jgi:hypothetical protein
MIADLTRVVLRRRKFRDRLINPTADLEVSGTDISSRDNAALATAASTIIGAFLELRELGFIDDHELIRIVYRFAGEVVDVEELLRRGKAAPKIERETPRQADQLLPFSFSPSHPISGSPRHGIDRINGQPENIDNA